jgi:putative endonuclease
METFFVYILLSKKTGKFYIGQTNNIENRLMKHNSGLNRSTKAGIPWFIVIDSARHEQNQWRLSEN